VACLETPRLLILLVIFLSQYIHAEGNLKEAQDGVPKAQYQYAMRLIEAGKKIQPLTGLGLLQHKGHLKSSLWIEQNIDYRKDEFITALIETNEELKDKVKSYTFDELEEIKKNGKAGDADTQFLLWLLYVNDLSISKPKAYVWIKKGSFQ
jgi:hypothetical protein